MKNDAERPQPREMTVSIDDVMPWEENSKTVKKTDYDRLKGQIRELGLYRRLLCFKEDGTYKTLGGNTTLRALKEMRTELGISQIGITEVFPRTEAEKLAYNLSDNDHVGQYDDQVLAEQIFKLKDGLNTDLFKIDLGKSVSLEGLLATFGPRIDAITEDDVPESEQETDVTLGDLFTIGEHRILCGDATKGWSYQALLGKQCTCPFCGEKNIID